MKWNFFLRSSSWFQTTTLIPGTKSSLSISSGQVFKDLNMLRLFLKLFCFHNLFNFQTILNATRHTQYNHKCQGRHFKFILLMTFVHIPHICLTLGTNFIDANSLILHINFSGCYGKKASRSFYDSIHADHSDEHCWTFNHVLQAVLLWGSGSQKTIKNTQMSWCLFSRSRST